MFYGWYYCYNCWSYHQNGTICPRLNWNWPYMVPAVPANNSGWSCPKCQWVLSPTTPWCPNCCKSSETVITDDETSPFVRPSVTSSTPVTT